MLRLHRGERGPTRGPQPASDPYSSPPLFPLPSPRSPSPPPLSQSPEWVINSQEGRPSQRRGVDTRLVSSPFPRPRWTRVLEVRAFGRGRSGVNGNLPTHVGIPSPSRDMERRRGSESVDIQPRGSGSYPPPPRGSPVHLRSTRLLLPWTQEVSGWRIPGQDTLVCRWTGGSEPLGPSPSTVPGLPSVRLLYP